MSCAICNKRKEERFCPAKDERICAVCCGTEREVTIDCPSDCQYLIAARRYDNRHRKAVSAEEMPFPDVAVSPHVVRERRPVLSGLGYTILKCLAAQGRPGAVVDQDAMVALEALADTYRTLSSGIYYEKPPAAPVPQQLYAELARFIQEYQKQAASQSRQPGLEPLKDSEAFPLIVFLLRLARTQTSGRPRSRAFLDFLRAQFPASPELKQETPRIIAP